MLCCLMQDFLSKITVGAQRGGAGAPLRASNGQIQTRLPISFAKNDYGGFYTFTNVQYQFTVT